MDLIGNETGKQTGNGIGNGSDDAGLAFVKGHGTRNDFVVLPDLDGSLDLHADLVAALCDRRGGIGADGVLRVVRSGNDPAAVAMAAEAAWFMDYRNADGSLSETCGNGLRVFARFLVDAGLAQPGRLAIATRAGIVHVDLATEGDVTVDMGAPAVFETSAAGIDGVKYEGLHVSMGNPHLVCITDTNVDSLDLTRHPEVDESVFPDGVNVEFVNVIDETHAVMRVHERGVGETESCGSGACAVAAALAVRQNVAGGEWDLDVPGGRLRLILDPVNAHVFLRGPAVLVAAGHWIAH
ncbi:MAG: diaminopimelate epimerase [Acidothermaceae bacterium]